MTLHPLNKVVDDWGIGSGMVDPVGFMKRQIKAGKITAHKIGRTWWMTEEEIQAALDSFASQTQPAAQTVPEPLRRGPSAASLKRRLSA